MDKAQIEKLAQLAKLSLTDEEKEKFQAELGGILEHMKELDGVDLETVPETNQVTGLTNQTEEDTAQKAPFEKSVAEEILATTERPVEMRQVGVPQVFE